MAFDKDLLHIPPISYPTLIANISNTTMVNFQQEADPVAQSIYYYLPLVVLGLESICGLLCNGAVLLLFCVRKSLLRTASDFFTINLSLVDLIFSGLVLPVVLITALTGKSCDEKSNDPRVMEIARNCIIIFGTVATALGTLLVSLDRGDVSLKPSKRFFTHSKAIIAIGITWCISTLGLAVTILPNLLTIDERSITQVRKEEKISTYIKAKLENETRIQYLKTQTENNCLKCHPCNGMTIKSCTIQLIFEIPIFVAAILTIIIIYGRILCSVQRRSKKYMQGSPKQNNTQKDGTNMRFCGRNLCCGTQNNSPQRTMNEKSKLKSFCRGDESQTKYEREHTPTIQSKSNSKIKRKTFLAERKKKKKQDSLEDSLFVTPCSKQEEYTPKQDKYPNKQDENPKSSNTPKVNKHDKSKAKTDFASVAMSVTVVLAIKRMAARKIKERKKKIRHLRKMTFFIVFTFLFCWTPYYMSKLSIAMSIYIGDSYSVDIDDLFNATTNLNSYNPPFFTTQCYPVWMFNWMLAIAALSCILNPALYIFSREKIRLEFLKTFFPSCLSDAGGGNQNRFTSCFICWDSEDNFKGKHETTKRSVITTERERSIKRRDQGHLGHILERTLFLAKRSTLMKLLGWQKSESAKKLNVELQKMATNGCDNINDATNSTHNDEIQRKGYRVKAPLIRWEAVTCETPHVSQDGLDDCIDEAVPNNELLLPPSHSRTRSLSARSMDVLSCSTTIASLAAEL
uniref:uncharacterized protein LOC120328692 isoform X1 n=1 Tax=Styela clava TaxID=7725 RepID=UPI00193AD9AE|nr:uncharacterized protein LOC120328692 isoform X1 [Styela clava]